MSVFFPGHVLQRGSPLESAVEIEVFVEFTCPFSARLWRTVFGAADGVAWSHPEITFIVRQVPQPWHLMGAFLHEAALAARRCVGSARDTRFLQFLTTLFAQQLEFFDINVQAQTPASVKARLAALATQCGIDGVGALLAFDAERLARGESEPGSGVSSDLKACVRYHRVRSVHVTPTVFINGIEASAVSSAWTREQWNDYLKQFITQH